MSCEAGTAEEVDAPGLEVRRGWWVPVVLASLLTWVGAVWIGIGGQGLAAVSVTRADLTYSAQGSVASLAVNTALIAAGIALFTGYRRSPVGRVDGVALAGGGVDARLGWSFLSVFVGIRVRRTDIPGRAARHVCVRELLARRVSGGRSRLACHHCCRGGRRAGDPGASQALVDTGRSTRGCLDHPDRGPSRCLGEHRHPLLRPARSLQLKDTHALLGDVMALAHTSDVDDRAEQPRLPPSGLLLLPVRSSPGAWAAPAAVATRADVRLSDKC